MPPLRTTSNAIFWFFSKAWASKTIELLLRHLVDTAADRTHTQTEQQLHIFMLCKIISRAALNPFAGHMHYIKKNFLAGRIQSLRGPHAARGPYVWHPWSNTMGHGWAQRTPQRHSWTWKKCKCHWLQLSSAKRGWTKWTKCHPLFQVAWLKSHWVVDVFF